MSNDTARAALEYLDGWITHHLVPPKVPAYIAALDDMRAHIRAALERLSQGGKMEATSDLMSPPTARTCTKCGSLLRRENESLCELPNGTNDYRCARERGHSGWHAYRGFSWTDNHVPKPVRNLAAEVAELRQLLATECSLSQNTVSAMLEAQRERDAALSVAREWERLRGEAYAMARRYGDERDQARAALRPFAEAYYFEVHTGTGRAMRPNAFRPEDVERARAVFYGNEGGES